MAAGQRRRGQAPFAGPTAVVGDAEGAALVVVQSAACGGGAGEERQGHRSHLPGPRRLRPLLFCR